jgi:glucuronate isomerase
VRDVRAAAAPAIRDQAGAEPLTLHEDRFFSPYPAVRRVARSLYEETRALPLVCPHGHVEPALLAEDAPFPEPTALLLIPDHYIFRMLYSQGVPLEALGVPTIDGSPVETDARKIWRVFASFYYLFRGTPTGIWLDNELHDVFGVRVKLTGETADRVYDEIREKLESPEFRPRALFERFNISVLATTDDPCDDLSAHATLAADPQFRGRVLPTFRPDRYLEPGRLSWPDAVTRLGAVAETDVGTYRGWVAAMENRRAHFRAHGAVSADHAPEDVGTNPLPPTWPSGSIELRSTVARPNRRRPRSAGTCSSKWPGCPVTTDWS